MIIFKIKLLLPTNIKNLSALILQIILELNRIESNTLELNRIKSNTLESNTIKSNENKAIKRKKKKIYKKITTKRTKY